MERCITTKKQKHMNFPTCDAGMQRAFSLPLKCWWSDTDKVNPLGMAEPGGNKPFVWRGAGVWARSVPVVQYAEHIDRAVMPAILNA
eukprot:1139582-Pelagomonas_calceolata.AAC.1